MFSHAKRRLTILTEIISPYRIPVFNALMRDPGIDLHVIFMAETDTNLRQWRVYKDEIKFSYEVLRSRRWRVGKRSVLLNSGVASALRAAAPDSIVCGGYNYLASWEALRWAQRNRVAFLLWSESNSQDKRGGHAAVEFLKREFLKRCAGFVVPGKSASIYLQSLGLLPERIITAPNAVDTEFFTHGTASAREQESAIRKSLVLPRHYILYVGRLVKEKGIFDLLDAYACLDAGLRSAFSLIYVGDGPARAELEEKATRIIPGSVILPGFAQREQLVQYYAFAETMILPTHSDTWGLVVNEAMVCGLPVIVTNVAGCVPDLVVDSGNGYVVPSRNSERLSGALDRLLRDPEMRSRMGEKSRERIEGYSPEACARGLAQAAHQYAMEMR
jgi:glycosyltransferase involved in cell wall biosynthesis